MATVTRDDGVRIRYETLAPDAPGRPVVFVGDAGYGGWQWGWQAPAVAGPRPAVVYDHRGTGGSDAPPGPYASAPLVDDLRAVIDAAGVGRPHLVAAGFGGPVALRAVRAGLGVRSLTLLGTAASGTAAEGALDRLYAPPADRAALERTTRAAVTDRFGRTRPEVIESIVDWRADEDAGPGAVEAQVAAARGIDVDALYEVTAPALVVHGRSDGVWSVDAGRRLAADLPRGTVHAPDAGHLVGVEASRPVNDLLVGHVDDVDGVDGAP
jgi:pimeloyl-ACP methyl ester carboxylesterase